MKLRDLRSALHDQELLKNLSRDPAMSCSYEELATLWSLIGELSKPALRRESLDAACPPPGS